MAKHMARTCREEPRSATDQPRGAARALRGAGPPRRCYLNDADHDDANPRGEKVLLKQFLQRHQAALRTEGR